VLRAVAGWKIWSESSTTLVLLLSVEFAALALPGVIASPFTVGEFWLAALLASLSIAHSIYAVSPEGTRQALNRQRRPLMSNMQSIWTFAAAVMLQSELAAIVVVLAAAAQWPVKNADGKAVLYRYVYSTAGVVLAAMAANRVMTAVAPYYARLACAGLTYLVVDAVVLASAISFSVGVSGTKFLLKPMSQLNEVVTISVGIAEACLNHAHIPLIWLSLPAAVGIQRLALRSEIRSVEQQPGKPMTEKVWSMVAAEVVRACATASVLRIDTDDPIAARAVAQLQAGCDAIGTVGRSGLAVLLADCPGNNADSLALRLRSALSNSGVAASVAVAAKPRDGQSLEDLLAVSEAELITRDAATRSARSLRPEA
jgi:hypothetical protein